ncbi:MAG TPA: hypothetical protein VEQ61_07055 [Thermoleophilaceae bacterium]|nr:hypothetical protein [Thermoleophilaceae bacterium]
MSSTVRERAPESEQERAPDWAPAPQGAGTGAPSLVSVLLRAAVAVAVAAVMWWLGHRVPALVLITVISLVTAASLLIPAVAAAIDRGVRFIQRVAGRALTFVLVGGVQLFVFTPISLVLRLLRRDPLEVNPPADDSTFWAPAPRGPRDLYRRPFGYERTWSAGEARGFGRDGLPFPRIRAALGVVALLALLDVGLGAAVNGVGDLVRDDSPRAGAQATGGGLAAQDLPAGNGETWRVPLGNEINEVFESMRYDPYLGWKLSDYAGEHVHVSGGVRRSYQATGSQGRDAVTVYFMGGSTMFGLYQRDEHTIPSEVTRLAAADGITLRVVNYGRLAYVNRQEVLLLEQLASAGKRPDLAVFYDGFNEVLSQFQDGPHREPSHLQARDIEARLGLGDDSEDADDPSLLTALRRAWADSSFVHRVGRRLGLVSAPAKPGEPAPRKSIWPGDQAERPERRGGFAASIHARGVDTARRLGDSYGFPTAFFWQPFLYGKRAVPGERKVQGWLGTDADAWTAVNRAARSRLDPRVMDISTALDGVKDPVMYDFVHTNELGARVVARALYEKLQPRLRRLAEERRP